MDAKKLAVILVLVVVAMLFVIALAAGSGRGNGDPARPSGIVDALEGLKSSHFMRIGAGASTTCGGSAEVLAFAGGCSITIDARGRFSGPTRAVFVSQVSQVVVTMKPEHGPELDLKVNPGKCAETAVDRKGGVLVLTCRTVGQCALAIPQAGCPHRGFSG